jgi:hypothetical protein
MGERERTGMLIGMLVALVILTGMGLSLLLAEGSSIRALVLVWLWLLPFLGSFGVAGALVARATVRGHSRRKRPGRSMPRPYGMR